MKRNIYFQNDDNVEYMLPVVVNLYTTILSLVISEDIPTPTAGRREHHHFIAKMLQV